MLRQILMGTAAGAVGTVALNVTTYADMAIRGRPASSTPSQLVGAIADRAGVNLSGEGADDSTVENRKSGLGALSGFLVGLGVGTGYGLLRLRVRHVPMPAAAAGLGLAAMAGSDVPIAALGVSDPRTWGVSGWAADIIPHLAYGFFTALAYEAFATTD